MTVERRTRLTLLLPAPVTSEHFLFVDATLTALIQLDGGGGATATLQREPVVEGWWYDPMSRVVVPDAHVLILADILAPIDSPALVAFVEDIKRRAQRALEQTIIWATLHEVRRVATYDGER